jgi:hypothetical protein
MEKQEETATLPVEETIVQQEEVKTEESEQQKPETTKAKTSAKKKLRGKDVLIAASGTRPNSLFITHFENGEFGARKLAEVRFTKVALTDKQLKKHGGAEFEKMIKENPVIEGNKGYYKGFVYTAKGIQMKIAPYIISGVVETIIAEAIRLGIEITREKKVHRDGKTTNVKRQSTIIDPTDIISGIKKAKSFKMFRGFLDEFSQEWLDEKPQVVTKKSNTGKSEVKKFPPFPISFTDNACTPFGADDGKIYKKILIKQYNDRAKKGRSIPRKNPITKPVEVIEDLKTKPQKVKESITTLLTQDALMNNIIDRHAVNHEGIKLGNDTKRFCNDLYNKLMRVFIELTATLMQRNKIVTIPNGLVRTVVKSFFVAHGFSEENAIYAKCLAHMEKIIKFYEDKKIAEKKKKEKKEGGEEKEEEKEEEEKKEESDQEEEEEEEE